MKNFINSAIVILIIINFKIDIYAQNDKDTTSSNKYKNEIGVVIWRSSPYLISYKKYFKNNKAIRFGLRMRTGNFDLTSSSNNSSRLNKSFSYDIRLGIEWYKNIFKKIIFYYGIDLSSNYRYSYTTNYNNNDSLRSTRGFQTISAGIAPVIGLRYVFNTRISLSTEILPTFSFYYRLEENAYSSPNYNSSSITKTSGINFKSNSTGAIYLNLYF
ncbi:MAG: hypothetical protein FVQ77_02625 [Cytophagales bacterium]|nr:hypothetical protein [Cytophagales bacterium]